VSDDDIALCIDAFYDNAIDGRIADEKFGSDFDAAEAELRASFVEFLGGRL
jgi:truncated hemoglobin YjbI